MSKITNDGLTRSGTGCSIAVPYGNSCRQRVKKQQNALLQLQLKAIVVSDAVAERRRGDEKLRRWHIHRWSHHLSYLTRSTHLAVALDWYHGICRMPQTDKHTLFWAH